MRNINSTNAKGSNPSIESMREYAKESNFIWDEKAQKGFFINLNENVRHIPRANLLSVAKYYLSKHKNIKPSKPLPFVRSDLKRLDSQNNPKSIAFVWLGHSSLFISTRGLNMLIDPVLSDFAAPKKWINRAFTKSIYNPQDFPNIDVLLITHDHYDHLDYHSILALEDKVALFVVPLGVGSHLQFWGIEKRRVIELNWFQSVQIAPLVYLTATPAQHSSGRGLEWNRTLWASFVLQVDKNTIFFSGDGGYYRHFKAIGDMFNGFTLAFLENGQYNTAWRYSHSFTNEVLQAAKDLRTKMVIPIHYGRFVAGSHAWNEPLKCLIKLCDKANIPISVPRIGEVYEIGSKPLREVWWDFD